MKKILFLIGLLLVLLILIIIIVVKDTRPIIEAPKEPSISTQNWQIYKNDQYGFEFKYPNNWISAQYQATSPQTPQVDLTTKSTLPNIRIYFLAKLSDDLDNNSQTTSLGEIIKSNQWNKISQRSFNSLHLTEVQTNNPQKPLILYLASPQSWLKIEFKDIARSSQLIPEEQAFLKSIKFY